MTKEKIFETINKLCETDSDDIIGCIEDTCNTPSDELNDIIADYIMDEIQSEFSMNLHLLNKGLYDIALNIIDSDNPSEFISYLHEYIEEEEKAKNRESDWREFCNILGKYPSFALDYYRYYGTKSILDELSIGGKIN